MMCFQQYKNRYNNGADCLLKLVCGIMIMSQQFPLSQDCMQIVVRVQPHLLNLIPTSCSPDFVRGLFITE